MDSATTDYVAQARATGKTDKQIREELVATGWRQEDAQRALESIPTTSVVPPKNIHSKSIAASVVAALFAITFLIPYGHTHTVSSSGEDVYPLPLPANSAPISESEMWANARTAIIPWVILSPWATTDRIFSCQELGCLVALPVGIIFLALFFFVCVFTISKGYNLTRQGKWLFALLLLVGIWLVYVAWGVKIVYRVYVQAPRLYNETISELEQKSGQGPFPGSPVIPDDVTILTSRPEVLVLSPWNMVANERPELQTLETDGGVCGYGYEGPTTQIGPNVWQCGANNIYGFLDPQRLISFNLINNNRGTSLVDVAKPFFYFYRIPVTIQGVSYGVKDATPVNTRPALPAGFQDCGIIRSGAEVFFETGGNDSTYPGMQTPSAAEIATIQCMERALLVYHPASYVVQYTGDSGAGSLTAGVETSISSSDHSTVHVVSTWFTDTGIKKVDTCDFPKRYYDGVESVVPGMENATSFYDGTPQSFSTSDAGVIPIPCSSTGSVTP